jgi:peroxiredoxin
MATVSLKKIALYTLTVLVTVVAALFLGSKVGDAINQRKLKKFEADRAKMKQAVLAKMENVGLGNRVGDHYFEDLNRNLVRLSDVITDKTVIIFIEPDCPACIDEIEQIQRVVKDSSESRHFIFVSSGNPLHLIVLRDEYKIQSPILYDHKDEFSSWFKVSTYPFNMIVNERLEIEDVIPAQLAQDKIEEIINSDEKPRAR